MRLIHIIIFILVTCFAGAQEINFKGNAPKYVRTGEQFQLVYSTNQSIDNLEPPSFNGFDYLGGPMQGSSTHVNIINGKTTRTSEYTFTYYLRAKEPGKYSLEPAKVKFKGKEAQSNKINIEVVGASGSSNPANNTQQKSTKDNSPNAKKSTGNELFLSLILDRTNAFVGEKITAYVKIYTKVNLAGFENTYKGPEFPGFFMQDIEVPPLRDLQRTKVGNEIYYTGLIQKIVLFPQKTGKITIEPFDLIVYKQGQAGRSRSLFDDFFGPQYQKIPVKLTSKPLTITVKSLPEDKPDGFTGAVGVFDIKGSLNTPKVKTNDAVIFKVTVSGTGNIKLLESIDYKFPSTLEVFEPIVKSKIDQSGTKGSKTFEFTAIPRHSGTFEVEPFRVVYFDTKSKTYKTKETESFVLEVEKGAGDSTNLVVSNLSKEEIELIGSDIRFIHTSTNLKKSGVFLNSRILFYVLYFLLVGLFSFIVIFKREQIKRNADIVRKKHRKANRLANKRLKKLKLYLDKGQKEQFYDELSKTLWGYISDKLNIPVSLLSMDNAKNSLLEKGLEEARIDELLKTISDCEFARYAPGTVESSPDNMYQNVVKLISNIDQKL